MYDDDDRAHLTPPPQDIGDLRELSIQLYSLSKDVATQARQYRELHGTVAALKAVSIATVGADGKNGALSRVVSDVDKLDRRVAVAETRLIALDKVHYKVMTFAAAGGFVAGVVAKFLPF